ncbi:hypothetical protein [Metapseudomonas resinovorans]|uniref:hypothetical protein n=1 Tax=Metapseudomonas resinovorans TaxID=53412 RepID=UPI0009DBA5AD|nr:hypothetical protein [Pseudomonas resinovorans]
MLAAINPCPRARKCNLVPYGAKNTLTGSRQRSKIETATGKGCCKGQAGHHLLNNKVVEDTCPKWTEKQAALAPTVCVEGTSWHKGSHKRVHGAMADILDKMSKDSKNTISLDQAMNAAAASHMTAFPYAGCSYKCIREQLAEFYKICRGSRTKVVNEQGKEARKEDSRGNDK